MGQEAMNNWNESELAFRCDRLSVRLERLTQNFMQIAQLSQDEINTDIVLAIVQESKSFLELTAIDLDVDNAFELAQMQRQLSRWHLHWGEPGTLKAIAPLTESWAKQMRRLAGVLV
jgi:hypothetical protein